MEKTNRDIYLIFLPFRDIHGLPLVAGWTLPVLSGSGWGSLLNDGLTTAGPAARTALGSQLRVPQQTVFEVTASLCPPPVWFDSVTLKNDFRLLDCIANLLDGDPLLALLFG